MYVARAIALWLLIIVVESVHGTVRQLFIAPSLGDLNARRLAVAVGTLLIFVIAYFCIPWVAAPSRKALLWIGLLWASLTLAFEIGLGLLLGYSTERIFEDYDVSRGGLMGFGLLFMALTPLLAARMRRPT